MQAEGSQEGRNIGGDLSGKPLINLEVQAAAAQKAITRYLRRYIRTLLQAGLTPQQAAEEVNLMLGAIRDQAVYDSAIKEMMQTADRILEEKQSKG